MMMSMSQQKKIIKVNDVEMEPTDRKEQSPYKIQGLVEALK